MDQEKKKRRTPEQVAALRERMTQVKKTLPAGGVSLFLSRYPDFAQSYQAGQKVNLVWLLRTVDEDITEKFEALALEYKPTNEKIYKPQ